MKSFILSLALFYFFRSSLQIPHKHSVVTVEEGQGIINTVDALYTSFTFDWWPNNTDQQGWGDAGILNIDLSNPRLIYLASQLQPAHIRIGGTLADTIVYEVPDTTYINCTEGLNCLNMTRWGQINQFMQETGLQLVFGLSEKYSKGIPGTWDPSNAQALLNYTINNFQYPVSGFELGNELNLGHQYPPSVCAKDFHTLRGIIDTIWSDRARPMLIGPDEVPDVPFLSAFLNLTGDIMDAVTYHLYIGYGGNPQLPEQILEPKFLDQIRTYGTTILQVVQQYAPNAELWCGETAAAYHSGQVNTTNAFVSGFWYLDELGTLAQLQHKVICRQTLVGGNYEVIAKDVFEPNPDYWTVLLWKLLMGRDVFQTQVSADTPHVRAYAHCAKLGGVTVVLINLANDTVYDINVKGLSGKLVPRVEYFLTSNDIRSQQIWLNGVELKLTTEGTLPPLTGKVVSDSSVIEMQPLSYGFVHLPNAGTATC